MIFIIDPKEIKVSRCVYGLYFYASWMPFHKKMLNMISNIEEKYKDKSINFYAIDTDNYKDICKKYEVTSIPYIIVGKNGKEVKRIDGVVMASAFKKVFSDIYKF